MLPVLPEQYLVYFWFKLWVIIVTDTTSKQGFVIPLTGDNDCFTEQAHCSVDHLLRSEKLEASYLHSNLGTST